MTSGYGPASLCEAYGELIAQELDRGRNSMGIWQDLVDRRGFNSGYQSVLHYARKLRATLHAKAKKKSDFRFYALYDKICRIDVLEHAYACCHANKDAAGIAGLTFDGVGAYGKERWLGQLAQQLREQSYHRSSRPGNGGRHSRAGNRDDVVGIQHTDHVPRRLAPSPVLIPEIKSIVKLVVG